MKHMADTQEQAGPVTLAQSTRGLSDDKLERYGEQSISSVQKGALTLLKRRSRSAGALCARSEPPQGSAISAAYTRKSV